MANDAAVIKLAAPASDPPDSEIADRVEGSVNTNADGSEDEVSTGADSEHRDDTPDEQPMEKRGTSGGLAQRRLAVSVSARSLVYGALVTILLGGVAALAWLYIGARHELDAQARGSSNDAHAEKVALDYAVDAATMNFQDLSGWKNKLVAGTTPELNTKLTKAAESMEQILIPLQWNSTAQPLIAKVHSDAGGVYVVDCFVSVQTKTVQAPDALQSTATYSLTIDRNKSWQITDVGGIGAVVGQK